MDLSPNWLYRDQILSMTDSRMVIDINILAGGPASQGFVGL